MTLDPKDVLDAMAELLNKANCEKAEWIAACKAKDRRIAELEAQCEKPSQPSS